ncbi:unnamed protein product [Camellia sinensis]
MELLGPEKVDPADVKLIKKKLFGYSTFWVTIEEPFGDLGEGILFLGNLRGKREEVFSKLQNQLAELMGNEYNLFMVEEPNSEGPDLRGGPHVSFGMLRKEVSEPGPTTLWQYVIALLLFVLTIGFLIINRLPPDVVKYFTYPNAIEPPDMQLLFPFVELCPGIWCPGGSAISRSWFKSILPDRKTKVDISLAGPFAGATLSFSMFVVGLLISSNPNAAGDLVQVPSMLFQGFLLLGLISRATLGYQCIQPQFGCGLTMSAFNMLPVGCLVGGRAIQEPCLREKCTNWIWFDNLHIAWIGSAWWTFVISLGSVCVDRAPEKPCLNDVTEVGTWRRTVLTVAIFLVVLTLLPVWDELAEELVLTDWDDVLNELYTLDDLDHQDGPENWAYHDLTTSSSPIMD